MTDTNNKEQALRRRLDEMQKKIDGLEGDNARLGAELEEARRHSDTVFCSTCDKKCIRDKIVCALCGQLSPEPSIKTRPKAYICCPTDGATKEERRKNWVKTKEYATKAFQEGYYPIAPQLYLQTFIDFEDENARKYAAMEATSLFFEVVESSGLFLICSQPTPDMEREIKIAEYLKMDITYKYDHPDALKNIEEHNIQTHQEVQKMAKENQQDFPSTDGKSSDSAAIWAEKKIDQFVKSNDKNGIRKIRNWAKKNIKGPALVKVLTKAQKALAAA